MKNQEQKAPDGKPGAENRPARRVCSPSHGIHRQGTEVPAGIRRGRGGDVPEARSGNTMMACGTRWHPDVNMTFLSVWRGRRPERR
ncbi:hypothetical protein BCEN4_120062 [Burkholderia cenocepacia]|nr:hypothetical protein BCEN4_120062 [Burkholderia cenocepacia]